MNQRERILLEHNLYIIGWYLPCIGAALFIIWGMLPLSVIEKILVPCLFHEITGLYCPGCGGTRAVGALLEGRFLISFFYHPIVIYCVILYLWFMISHTIEVLSGHRWKIGLHYRNLYLYLALIIVIINIAVKDIALTAFQTDLLKILEDAHALV